MNTILMVAALLAAAAIVGTVGVFGVMVLWKGLSLVGRVIGHVFSCLGGIVADTFRFAGAVIASLVFVPLVVANVVIGRWSTAAHFGRALSSELTTAGLCVYRVLLGHPARLLGLGGLTEGIERRLPQAMAGAPGADRPSRATGLFEGYRIVASLPGGGSGGKLYVAEPNELKMAAFARRGTTGVGRVVIKSFSLGDGSSLPQIVRESRALDAARKMGLVLEHDLSPERFFYVMRYVPGENLAAMTQRMHGRSAPSSPPGLDPANLREGLGYVTDLLETLETYHAGGLWHKDVKPENIIIDPTGEAGRPGRAHLVDFGLVTPLRSSMTLTTHGTEYYRDPEMVRQALKGVKVHQVDGARFDVFAAGAVLYSLIEASFPAHGGLSQVTRRCPEAVKWIIRRAMTDYEKRYPTAAAMLEDVRWVMSAADAFAVKPFELPSMRDPAERSAFTADASAPAPDQHAAATPNTPAPAAKVAAPTPAASRPRLTVRDWWTGRYDVDDASAPPAAPLAASAAEPRTSRRHPAVPAGERAPAKEQLRRARGRAAARRIAAQSRIGRRARGSRNPSAVNLGVVFAVFCLVGLAGGGLLIAMRDDGVANEASWDHALIDAQPLSGDRVLLVASDPTHPAIEFQMRQVDLLLTGRGADVVNAATEASVSPRIVEALHVASVYFAEDEDAMLRAARTVMELAGEYTGLVYFAVDEADFTDSEVLVVAGAFEAATDLPDLGETIEDMFDVHRDAAWADAGASVDDADPWEPAPLDGVLMLSDLRPPLAVPLAASLEEAAMLLTGSGVPLVGEIGEGPDDPAEAAALQSTLARLRLVRGARPLDDDTLASDLRGVEPTLADATALVWIAPAGRGDVVDLLIVAPGHAWSGSVDVGTIAATLRDHLSSLAASR